MELLNWIIGFIVAAAVALFAVSNRDFVELYFSPWHESVQVPLYAIGLGLLAFGFLFGTFLTWLNAAPIRQSKRKQNRKIKDLEKALEATNENGKKQNPPSDFFPALPKRAKK